MKTKLFIISLVCFLGLNLMASTHLITSADFMSLIKAKKEIIIIDASKAETYKTMHIKNAINIPHKTLYAESEVEGILKSPEELAKIFGKHGVSNTSSIIIYDEGSQKYSSRVYWVLEHLGATDVKILHRDMDEWKKNRVPLTRLPGKLPATTFTVKLNNSVAVDMAYVKTKLNNSSTVLVDARTAAEFKGTSTDPLSPGHIPGAINLNYEDVLDAKKAFKSKEEITAIAKKHGITSDKEIILYCKTSIRGAVLFAAFSDILGYPNVKVYDGALAEWQVSNKVEK